MCVCGGVYSQLIANVVTDFECKRQFFRGSSFVIVSFDKTFTAVDLVTILSQSSYINRRCFVSNHQAVKWYIYIIKYDILLIFCLTAKPGNGTASPFKANAGGRLSAASLDV